MAHAKRDIPDDLEFFRKVAADDVARFLFGHRVVLDAEEPVEALHPHLELEQIVGLLLAPEHLEPAVDSAAVVLRYAIQRLARTGERGIGGRRVVRHCRVLRFGGRCEG